MNMLDCVELRKHFPVGGGSWLARRRGTARPAAARGRRRQLLDRQGRKRRPGGRVRLRQVDPRAPHHAHARSDRGRHHLRRPQHRLHTGAPVPALPVPAEDPDGVPGPDRQPESPPHGVRHHRRAAAAPRARHRPRRARAPGDGRRGARSACRRSCCRATRTSSPAARKRASASRARCPCRRRCWCSTSRPRRSTSRCRRRS